MKFADTGPMMMSEGDSHTWMHSVINLLDTAVSQLPDREEPAKCALIRATSLVRRQIDARHSDVAPRRRGALLAWQLRKLHHYVDEHIGCVVSVADLAALVGLSEAHFSRCFKATFGVPPHSFVISRRLTRAMQYMLESDSSLSDIALRCGFTDQAHLTRHFRRSTGHTPAAWRRACLMQGIEATESASLDPKGLAPGPRRPVPFGIETGGR